MYSYTWLSRWITCHCL